MSKIKFRIEVWDESVVFQVLDMDERFRGGIMEKILFITPKTVLA